ncbi:hypothetical protein M758_1G216800 [Ceratodon purpureus]|uniref:Cytochrome P450 n=1 Tax=Ceratodon purpureus TaxID=3225 RepID=A0A8T0J823_CERPU|nr:hypothetical protein KC19_1G203600 [Ceratodon purpureus]KAG0591806.1 hypothetical protein KC19_1G203600 [Ceratodon purpureus]KAG0591807.1 hypothetical protein KC19_1G203600 [Ceratodon purpureus]KAG0630962.1 hypothetical protein M758_1G216800 [Ceratodon purpureus]KAG0630963.1 hypothetical protein M758_1G216800 [Ceratodon purpureus]
MDLMLALGSRLGLIVQLTKENSLWTTFLAVTVLVLGKCLMDAFQRKRLPPGPRAWPIFGNMFNLGPLPWSYTFLRELARKHGGLMYLRMGSIPCIVISSSSMAKEVVINHDQQFAFRPVRLFSNTLCKCKDITTSYGPNWRHLRLICTSQFFTKKRISMYEAGRTEEVHTLIKQILRKSGSREDSVVDLPFQLKYTTTNIISRMVFNKRLFVEGDECNLQEAKRYQEVISLHFRTYAVFVISDYFPSLSFITDAQGMKEKMQKVVEQIYKALDEIIDFEEHHRRRMDHANDPEADRDQDFVDLLLATPSHDGVGTLDHETIRGIVMNMLIAGTETQASTLEWAMAYLLQHPDVMKQAQAELDNVVGTQRIVQESDLEHLPYLGAVIKEVSRMQPGAPMSIYHESREKSRMAGYDLPARTRLIFNIHAINRDPCVYDRPDKFDPSRFLRPQGSSHDSFQFMTYGAGRRICPGMPLATLNMAHILAHMLHSFDWKLPGDQDPQDLDMTAKFDGLTAPKKYPLLIIPQPRLPAFLY